MDLIIRLILSIFEEVFSKDAKRRREDRARVAAAPSAQARPPSSGAPGQQGPRDRSSQGSPNQVRLPGRGAPGQPVPQARQGQPPVQKRGFLEELFNELESLGGPTPQKAPARAVPRREPPPVPAETYKEHVAKGDRRRLEKREEMDRHFGATTTKVTDDHRDPFRLPGETALQQMIYAQVILGPCKARRGTRTYL